MDNNQPTTLPQEPVMITPSEPKKSHALLLGLGGILLIGLGLLGGYFLFGNNNIQPSSQKNTPLAQISPSPTTSVIEPSVTPTIEIVNSIPCKNKGLGIQLKIPHTWTCQSEELGEGSGSLIVKSSLFNVGISNLGRGLYCGGTGDDPTCKTSEFYKNSKVNLTLYTSNGIDGEIFGGITAPSRPFMWVKYEGMDKRKLTIAEKNDLIQVIESLVITN